MTGSAIFDHPARCHCSAVRFTVTSPKGLASARRCDCSFCTMRGAVAISAPLDGVTFSRGVEKLTLYQFNTRTAKHYFCKDCGIYTHHLRRSDQNEFGVNVSCLEGVTPWALPKITVNDGQKHASDGDGITRVAGVLTYEQVSR